MWVDWLSVVGYLPHPTYGNCGGRPKNCCRNHNPPVDKLDQAFELHDIMLCNARKEPNEIKRKEFCVSAHKTLASNLRKDLGKLSLYGKLYAFFAKLIFKVAYHL